jgi:hypothetical protein
MPLDKTVAYTGAPIIDPRRRNIGVTQAFLNLRDVCLMVEGVRSCSSAQRVGADLEAWGQCVAADQLIGI